MMKPIAIFFCISFIGIASNAQDVKTGKGAVMRFEKFASAFIDARNVDVWLPDDYSRKKQYAVLYMHDGQMLFDSTMNWNRQEWMVDETVGALLEKKAIRDFIVVGVWNNGNKRHAEYFPQKAIKNLSNSEYEPLIKFIPTGPLADNYLRFLVKELKPFTDSSFSTLKDRNNTFIAGSSMGALISLYAICEFPEVFGGAACLSTHWTGVFYAENNPIPAAILKYLDQHVPDANTHKIYFDHGTTTIDSMYAPFQQMADSIMQKHGYDESNLMSKVFEGEPHTEKAWAKRLDIPLMFLMKR